jgi:hypothetical protein
MIGPGGPSFGWPVLVVAEFRVSVDGGVASSVNGGVASNVDGGVVEWPVL